MSSPHPGTGRGLQRISTTSGFVLAVDLRDLDGRDPTDDDRGRQVLGILSPWASAVVVPDSDLGQEWLDSETVPRSLGVIRPVAAERLRTTDTSAESTYAGADALLASANSLEPNLWSGPILLEFSSPSMDDAAIDDIDYSTNNAALAVLAGLPSAMPGWQDFDEAFAVPWLVAPAAKSFPEIVAHGRDAVAAGASGLVIGRQLWVDLSSDDDPALGSGAIEELRSRIVTLVGAIRSGMGTWDLEEWPTNDALQWFGARSFVYHDDIDRYEERTVLIRAHSDEAALSAAGAEAAEYADAQGATALDVVQISPIRFAPGESNVDLIEWQEVYTQFHDAASDAEFLNRFVPSAS